MWEIIFPVIFKIDKRFFFLLGHIFGFMWTVTLYQLGLQAIGFPRLLDYMSQFVGQ